MVRRIAGQTSLTVLLQDTDGLEVGEHARKRETSRVLERTETHVGIPRGQTRTDPSSTKHQRIQGTKNKSSFSTNIRIKCLQLQLFCRHYLVNVSIRILFIFDVDG
jgi:hypothetical protein